MTLEIAKMLVLSTSHVTRETARTLDSASVLQTGHPVVTYAKGEYGWFVNVPCQEFLEKLKVAVKRPPDDLLGVLTFARAQGCDWIMFDRDGDRIDALPSWEW